MLQIVSYNFFFVHRMQNSLEALLVCLKAENNATTKLEADLANLCFTLQHYETAFADVRKLVGYNAEVSTTNLAVLIALFFESLNALQDANSVLEKELFELKKPAIPDKVHRQVLSRVEIEEVWNLYDIVADKLNTIDVLKRDLRVMKKIKLQGIFNTNSLNVEFSNIVGTPQISRVLFRDVSNTSTSTELQENLGEPSESSGKQKKPRKRKRRKKKSNITPDPEDAHFAPIGTVTIEQQEKV